MELTVLREKLYWLKIISWKNGVQTISRGELFPRLPLPNWLNRLPVYSHRKEILNFAAHAGAFHAIVFFVAFRSFRRVHSTRALEVHKPKKFKLFSLVHFFQILLLFSASMYIVLWCYLFKTVANECNFSETNVRIQNLEIAVKRL